MYLTMNCNMRYAAIHSLDVSNGAGIGVALFVQGCHFHCKNCFNQCTWDFTGGKPWTQEVENKFFSFVTNPRVDRVSFLGGEPLEPANYNTVLDLCKKVKALGRQVWLFTGYDFEDVQGKSIMQYVDVCVDGQYIDEMRDFNLLYRGSSNQRVINVPATYSTGEIVLYKPFLP